MPDGGNGRPGYDAVVAGASLAGCAAAIFLGRAGARVALVEKSPDPRAFKRICSHYVQASAVPTLDRLDLLEPIVEAGGLRSRMRPWTPWGWLETPPERAGYGVNLRREHLDPLLRETAAETPGVELMLGWEACGLLREGEAVKGLTTRDREGEERMLHGQLVVGADGRDSHIAEMAGVKTKTSPHGRFAFGAYYEDPRADPENASFAWLMDPDWAAAFPTDAGLVFYAAMPTKDRLGEFRRDPEAALVAYMASLPEAPPPIRESRRVGPLLGKIEMPNRVSVPVAPGLALVGDAAMAVDPLFGVGCGWALQSAEWLADSVAPALRGEEPLRRGLGRYRRKHRRELSMHAYTINEYASGRRTRPGERFFFAAAARDPEIAAKFDELVTRRAKPLRTLATSLPRAVATNSRGAAGRLRDKARGRLPNA
ncbi:MAG TPA: NAD(P)/FAD-dependent oxidoreductase [Solirubrobacterales bacterium]|nr:NAD(P)/FAD-dependent oxidoreductase [Solirubrobacterales bacterium]